MTTRKITDVFPPHTNPRQGEACNDDTLAERRQPIGLLDLEIENDSGGDPYNRTGQFCIAELKKRDS